MHALGVPSVLPPHSTYSAELTQSSAYTSSNPKRPRLIHRPTYCLHSHLHSHSLPLHLALHSSSHLAKRSAGWDHESHEFHVSDKKPDYAHADPCRQERRSAYVFKLFVSRPSAPNLSSKLKQLPFKATAEPAHLTEVNVGVFFEQVAPSVCPHRASPCLPPLIKRTSPPTPSAPKLLRLYPHDLCSTLPTRTLQCVPCMND